MADRELFDGLDVTGTPRNNATVRAGLVFQVQTDEVLNALGRWVLAGNSQTHTLWLGIYTQTGVGVGSATIVDSVTVDTNGATANAFLYAYFASPITLTAGVNYVIWSSETNGGDQWLDADTFPGEEAGVGPGLEFDLDQFTPCYTTDMVGDVASPNVIVGVASSGQAYVPVGALWEGTGALQTITDAGAIASSAAFGTATVATGAPPQTITDAGGIASTAALGSPTVLNVSPDADQPNTVAVLLGTVSDRRSRTGTDLCPCDDFPLLNDSAEGPDTPVWVANRPWGDPDPPIGVPYQATGCLGVATSTISQADADAQALAQAALCVTDPNPNPLPDSDPTPGDTPPPGSPPGSVIFYNTQHEQDVCPSDVFEIVGALPAGYYVLESGSGIGILAGEFHSWSSQADANAVALANLRATITALELAGIINCLPRCGHPEDTLGPIAPYVETLLKPLSLFWDDPGSEARFCYWANYFYDTTTHTTQNFFGETITFTLVEPGVGSVFVFKGENIQIGNQNSTYGFPEDGHWNMLICFAKVLLSGINAFGHAFDYYRKDYYYLRSDEATDTPAGAYSPASRGSLFGPPVGGGPYEIATFTPYPTPLTVTTTDTTP